MARDHPASAGARRWPLAAVLGGYALLAVGFIWRIPPGEAPDEGAHLAYVAHLATEHSLPVFEPSSGSYEAHQPPLYYALAVPVYWLADGQGGHTALYAVRVMSAAIGAGVIYLLFLLGRRFFANLGLAPVAVAAVGAFVPMHVALFVAVSNDGLLILLATLALYLSLEAVDEGLSPARAALLGVVLGLGMLTKTAILPFAAVAMAAAVWGMRRAGRLPGRVVGQRLALLVGVGLLLSGWWLARNVALYGDPLALKRFLEVFGRTSHAPSYFADHELLSPWQFRLMFLLLTHLGFWGMFDNLEEYMPWWFHGLGAALVGLAVLGLVRVAASARRGSDGGWRPRGAQVAVLAVVAALVVASYLSFNARFFQAQARYLFPAMGPYAAFAVMGWRGLLGERRGDLLLTAILAIMALMSLAALCPSLRVPYHQFWGIWGLP